MSKGVRITVLIFVAVWIAWACAAPVREPPAPAATPDAAATLGPADSVLLQVALRVVRIGPRMEQVWPGFWSPEQAFIVYQPGEAVLLVSPHVPPAGFLPLRGAVVPRELQERTYLRRGTLQGLEAGFRIDFPAGATTATAVAADPEGVRATVTTLFHEAFHGYQSRRFAASGSFVGEYVDPSQVAASEFRAMAEVERRMLATSLDLPVDSLPGQLQQYLAVRWLRTLAMDSDVRAVEKHLERVEGSAHLVGLEAGLLASGEGREQLPRALLPYLTRSLDSFSGPLVERMIRWRVYGTGAAIGLLLDWLEVAWRSRMEEGADFDELLGAAVRFDTAAAPALAAVALERYGFGELLAEITLAPDRAQIRSLEDFHRLAPARLVVEFVVPIESGRPNMSVNFSGGTEGFLQLEANLLALPDPEVFTLQVPQGSLVVRARPVLQDMRHIAEERLRITVLLPDLPVLAGGQSLSEGEHRMDGLRLEADGVQLTLEQPVSIQVRRGEWIIRSPVVRHDGTRTSGRSSWLRDHNGWEHVPDIYAMTHAQSMLHESLVGENQSSVAR
jgi:hypothetical protein